MSNERYIYNKGDIEIKKSQCDFCKNNLGQVSTEKCDKFPNGKPEDVQSNKRKCPCFDLIKIEAGS